MSPLPSSPAPRSVLLLHGSAHPALATHLARQLEAELGRCAIRRFPDGEIHLEVDGREVDGRDVFFVQPTSKGAAEHLFEVLLAADACRHAGARAFTALVPYFGYARQDRRSGPGEALGARVVAEMLGSARIDRIVVVDVHGEAVEAALDVPVERLSAAPLLAAALEKAAIRDAVVVAPDCGAARLAREYARALRLPLAVVHKLRTSATDVSVEGVAGDVRGLRPILVDDIVATGGTLLAAARALAARGSAGDPIVAATHAVFTPAALDRLRGAGLRRMLVTDTVAPNGAGPREGVEIVSVAPLLATCVRRLAARSLAAHYLSHP